MNPVGSFSSPAIPLHKDCRVLDFHPAGIWALNKSCGILSHPNPKKSSTPTLLNCTYDFDKECYNWKDEQGNQQYFFLVHRLDSATSGIILITSKEYLAQQLKKSFSNQEVQKTYYAIVRSNGKPLRQKWDDLLQKKTSNGKIRVLASKHGVPCSTKVSTELKKNTEFGLLLLLRLMPKTGRTHQLRVQCAKRNLPILGDRTYGDFSLNRKINQSHKVERLFLHAAKIKIAINNQGEKSHIWEVKSPMPPAFEKILN